MTLSSSKKGIKKVCSQGHTFYKSSTCPVCPKCEKERKSEFALMELISAPARRALESSGIDSIEKLQKYTIKELLGLHGFGPKAIRIIDEYLKNNNLSPLT